MIPIHHPSFAGAVPPAAQRGEARPDSPVSPSSGSGLGRRPRRRALGHRLTLAAALSLVAFSSSAATAGPPQPGVARLDTPQPGAPRLDTPQPGAPRSEQTPSADAELTATASDPLSFDSPLERIGPVVHVVERLPDPERGVVKLARMRDTSVDHRGNITLVTVNYFELCNVPCGVPVDVSERPLFFFVRDGSPITDAFRIPAGADEVTIEFSPNRRGMLMAGVTLTSMMILPVGIPLWIAGKSRMWIAPGDPSTAHDFVRLKRAKR